MTSGTIIFPQSVAVQEGSPSFTQLRPSDLVEFAGQYLSQKILEQNDAHWLTRYHPACIISASLLSSVTEMVFGTAALSLKFKEPGQAFKAALWQAPLEGLLVSDSLWDIPGNTYTALEQARLKGAHDVFVQDKEIAQQMGNMLLSLFLFRYHLGQGILDGTLFDKIEQAPTQAIHSEILAPMTQGTMLFYGVKGTASGLGLLRRPSLATTTELVPARPQPIQSLPLARTTSILPKAAPPPFTHPVPGTGVAGKPPGRAIHIGDYAFPRKPRAESPLQELTGQMFKRGPGGWEEVPPTTFAEPAPPWWRDLFAPTDQKPLALPSPQVIARVPITKPAGATGQLEAWASGTALEVDAATGVPLQVLQGLGLVGLVGTIIDARSRLNEDSRLDLSAGAIAGAEVLLGPGETGPVSAKAVLPEIPVLHALHGEIVAAFHSSDGDTIFFKPDPPPEGFSSVWLELPNGERVKINNWGVVAIRMDFIDALETHFRGRHQQPTLANAATDALLEKLGVTEIEWSSGESPKRGRIVKAKDGQGVWLLASSVERYGRVVGCVMTEAKAALLPNGRTLTHGATTPFDIDLLKLTVNWEMVRDDFAYPTFYSELPPLIRGAVAMLVKERRELGQGLWAEDATMTPVSFSSIEEASALALLPKFYRRIVLSQPPKNAPPPAIPLEGTFMDRVWATMNASPDTVFLLGADELAAPLTGRTPTVLTDPRIMRFNPENDTIQFLVPPEQLVFAEK